MLNSVLIGGNVVKSAKNSVIIMNKYRGSDILVQVTLTDGTDICCPLSEGTLIRVVGYISEDPRGEIVLVANYIEAAPNFDGI